MISRYALKTTITYRSTIGVVIYIPVTDLRGTELYRPTISSVSDKFASAPYRSRLGRRSPRKRVPRLESAPFSHRRCVDFFFFFAPITLQVNRLARIISLLERKSRSWNRATFLRALESANVHENVSIRGDSENWTGKIFSPNGKYGKLVLSRSRRTSSLKPSFFDRGNRRKIEER